MCGRYTLTSSGEELARHFEAELELDLAPRFNVAPTQRVVGVRPADREDGEAAAGSRRFDLHRWGLIPAWARDETIAHRTFNARSETVSTKPAFRAAIRARRCLVPLNGFYEWRRRGRRRVVPSKAGARARCRRAAPHAARGRRRELVDVERRRHAARHAPRRGGRRPVAPRRARGSGGCRDRPARGTARPARCPTPRSARAGAAPQSNARAAPRRYRWGGRLSYGAPDHRCTSASSGSCRMS